MISLARAALDGRAKTRRYSTTVNRTSTLSKYRGGGKLLIRNGHCKSKRSSEADLATRLRDAIVSVHDTRLRDMTPSQVTSRMASRTEPGSASRHGPARAMRGRESGRQLASIPSNKVCMLTANVTSCFWVNFFFVRTVPAALRATR